MGKCQKCSIEAVMFPCILCGIKYCSICKNKHYYRVKIEKSINNIIRERIGHICETCGQQLWNSFEN